LPRIFVPGEVKELTWNSYRRRRVLVSTLVLVGLSAGSFSGCSSKNDSRGVEPRVQKGENLKKESINNGHNPVNESRDFNETKNHLAKRQRLNWATSKQLVLGVSPSWEDTKITLQRFTRDHEAGEWNPVGQPWQAVIGRSGLAWGIGLHGDGLPGAGLHKLKIAGPTKAEGDGRSVAGVFLIGDVFGYDKSPPPGTQSSYTQLDSDWRCIDDSSSTHYNRVLNKKLVANVDWSSAERMRRHDPLYRWVVLIKHNRISVGPSARAGGRTQEDPKERGGSCIFFHVWRQSTQPTVGCAAMEREQLEDLVTWLNPAEKPIVALLPQSQYRILRDSWRLPLVEWLNPGGSAIIHDETQ